jgi:hypothetical protein
MSTSATSGEWVGQAERQAARLRRQIASMTAYVQQGGGSVQEIEQVCAPFYASLAKLYQDDYPLAQAIESSDLLVRLEGAAIDEKNPRLSLISSVFGKVRKGVGSVAWAIARVSNRQSLPEDVDLGLTAYATGSLYLGFCLPPQGATLMDPLYDATKQAIHALGVVSERIEQGKSEVDIARDFPDPKVRDAALSAVQHLSPSGHMGINSVSLTGREFASKSFHKLTPESRSAIRKLIEHPVKSDEPLEFIGIIREMDLDLRRFELRRLVGSETEEVRCIYPENYDAQAVEWLNGKAKVFGKIERGQDGKPRLLQVERFDLLKKSTQPKPSEQTDLI